MFYYDLRSIKHLQELFLLFDKSAYTLRKGTAILSYERRCFLCSLDVATTRTIPYNPRGNGQIKTINLALRSHELTITQLEIKVFHSIRSFLCTAANATPHEFLSILDVIEWNYTFCMIEYTRSILSSKI